MGSSAPPRADAAKVGHEAPPVRARAFERILAAVVLGLPLLYLLTDRSARPLVLGWSTKLCAAIAGYGVFYVLVLVSYRRELPAWVAKLRALGVVSAAGILIGLLGIEVFLRASDRAAFEEVDNRGRHAFDPDLGHVYLPNFTQQIQSREFSQVWRSNAQGLRADRDYGKKPPGVKRVLVIGDSFTVGDQVWLEETYPGVMQSELESVLGPGRVEVLNAGFPGYGTVNETRWLAKFGAAFEPDVVVIGMTPNDLLENQYPLQYIARDGALTASASTEADRLRFESRKRWYNLPGWVQRSRLRQRILGSAFVQRLRTGSAFTHHRAFMVEQDSKSRSLYELAERYVLEARAQSEALGAKFALIVIPFLEQLGPLEENLDGAVIGRRWRELGERQSIPVLDLLPAFRAAPDPRALYWKEDRHCTAAGYRLIGEETARFLLAHAAELGLVAGTR
jgi:lysophospholipase L1-like esterase